MDENDTGEQARILVYLEHSIQDARTTQSGDRREASRQMQYVELDDQGQVHNALVRTNAGTILNHVFHARVSCGLLK